MCVFSQLCGWHILPALREVSRIELPFLSHIDTVVGVSYNWSHTILQLLVIRFGRIGMLRLKAVRTRVAESQVRFVHSAWRNHRFRQFWKSCTLRTHRKKMNSGSQEVSGSIPLISTTKNLETATVSRFLYSENHSLGEWFKRGCCRWGKIKRYCRLTSGLPEPANNFAHKSWRDRH